MTQRENVFFSSEQTVCGGFSGDCKIVRVTFPRENILKSIEEMGFKSCLKLLEIEIPAGVLFIGKNCFAQCKSLYRISFVRESCLRIIDDRAFYECSSIQEINIPASVEVIGNECFINSGINRITFASDSHLKEIGKMAFLECRKLQEIEIPATVETIREKCFYDCTSLSSVIFASGSVLKRVEEEAFSECPKLREIEIPASVEEIAQRAFLRMIVRPVSENKRVWGRTALSYVKFASGSILKRIGTRAFFGCTYLREIEIPASVGEIDDECFASSDISQITFATGCVLRRIGTKCFCNCCSIREIEIPESVEEIGDECFNGSTLSRITFAKRSVLKRIGTKCFCSSCHLTEIEIPASVEEIGDECFNSSYLTHVRFGAGSVLNCIGRRTFANCVDLCEIEIPASVENLDDRCFSMCCSLLRVTFADQSSLKRIQRGAFLGSGLRELRIPAHVDYIGPGAFYGCSLIDFTVAPKNQFYEVVNGHLVHIESKTLIYYLMRESKEIEIPTSVEKIGGMVFSGANVPLDMKFACGSRLTHICDVAFKCSSIRSIHIPASVVSIGKSCFQRSSDLTSVIFEAGSCLRSIGDSAFSSCFSLKEIEIPASVEEIGVKCFAWSSLSSVTYADGICLKSIRDRAFANTCLSKIDIPVSVEEICCASFAMCYSLSVVTFAAGSCLKRIGRCAFWECEDLEEIALPATIEEIGDECFYACALKTITFVGESSLSYLGERAFCCTDLEERGNPLEINLSGIGIVQIRDYQNKWARESITPSLPRIMLGMCSEEICQRFLETAKALWMEILPDVSLRDSVPIETISQACGMRFKKPEDSSNSAINTMTSVFSGFGVDSITFAVFAKVLAMFGPEEMIMQKFVDILSVPNNSRDWLWVGIRRDVPDGTSYARFDCVQPNCLVVNRPGKIPVTAWNLPCHESTDPYVIDESGKRYASWRNFFNAKTPMM